MRNITFFYQLQYSKLRARTTRFLPKPIYLWIRWEYYCLRTDSGDWLCRLLVDILPSWANTSKHANPLAIVFEVPMVNIVTKIATTRKRVVPKRTIIETPDEVLKLGKDLQQKIGRLFSGSLAIREVDAGSDNACEHELTALTNAFYDVERFGIRFVASPKHADMLLVTGPVSRNMAHALKVAYDCTPTPRLVVAVGDDAIDGGIFKGSYATYDGVSSVIPVDYAIPGDPPSPTTILRSLLGILEDLEGKRQ